MGKSHWVKRFFILLLSTIFTITQLITVPIFAAENDKNEDELLEVTQSLTPKTTDNTYKVGESFDIDYDIKPKDINKKEYDEGYKSKGKKKEIVLVMDTSGSMECPVKSDENKDYYYIQNWIVTSQNKLKVKVNGHSNLYEVEMGAQWYIEINKQKYYIEGNLCYKNFQQETRLNIAKDKAKEFIDQFKDEKNVSIGLVSFASKIKSIKPLTDDFSGIKNDIEKLKADGGTNIGEALRKAHEILDKSQNKEADKYIVLMTDGFPTAFTLVDYEKSIQQKTQSSNYWFNNYLGYVENDSNEICKFININNPKLKKGFDFENQEYAINYGDNDLNNYALKYSKEIGQKIKEDNINSFIIGFSDGANSQKLDEIAKSSGGEYREANDEGALKEAYDKIGTKVKAPLIKNLEFQFSIPQGLKIEEIKNSITNETMKPIKRDDKTYYINLENIMYDCNKDSNFYSSNNKKLKLKLKSLKEGEYEILSSINKKEEVPKKNICNKSIKVNVVKNSILELRQEILDKKYNGYHVGDEVKINYNIKLKPISNYFSESEDKDNKKEQITNKSKKKIVLVVDTSGSMDVNESNKRDKYVGTIIRRFNISEFRYIFFIRNNDRDTPIESNKILNGSFEINGKKVYVKGNKVYEYDENNHSRLECVKKVASNFVDKFKEDANTEIALVGYSNKGNIVGENNKTFINGKDVEIMNERIKSLKADGGTNIGDGIRKAYSILDNCDKDTEKYMILMTDGVPTAYTCYSDSVKMSNDYMVGNEWNSEYYPNGEVIENNRKYYYNKIDDFKFKLENDSRNESYIVKFGDKYDKNALKYAKQAMKESKNKNINNVIVGFSDGIDTEKLKEIAGDNAQYKEAKNLDELTKKYDEIEKDINVIKAPSIKNIEFNLKLPDGLEIIDDFNNDNMNFKLQKNDKLNNSSLSNVIGKIKDISYTKSEDEKRYIPQINNINFYIKVRVKENKNYVLGKNYDKAVLSYKDIYGIKYVEDFTPIINISMKTIDIKVDKFGVLKSNSSATIEECIQDNNVSIMNNFVYQVGMVIEPYNKSDLEDKGVIEEKISIKNNFVIDNNNKISKLNNKVVKGLFLYELNGNKLKEISKDKIFQSNGKITIKEGSLKKGQKYIVAQGILLQGVTNNTILKDDIEINDNKVPKEVKMKEINLLPDLD